MSDTTWWCSVCLRCCCRATGEDLCLTRAARVPVWGSRGQCLTQGFQDSRTRTLSHTSDIEQWGEVFLSSSTQGLRKRLNMQRKTNLEFIPFELVQNKCLFCFASTVYKQSYSYTYWFYVMSYHVHRVKHKAHKLFIPRDIRKNFTFFS